ncbi:MAG: hypothetical protein RR115_01535 [Hydrogenoanaerobacterium sp.]
MSEIKEFIKKLLAGDGKIKLIVLLGVCGILIILFSDITLKRSTQKNDLEGLADTQVSTGEATAAALEKRIYDIATSIEGVGKAKVLVTLENSAEYVYANSEKKNTDVTQDFTEKEVKKLHEKGTSEKNYILVDNGKGKEALVKTRIEPKVKGVVIVCEGAEDILTEERLIKAVTTALAISSNQVCIAKMATK